MPRYGDWFGQGLGRRQYRAVDLRGYIPWHPVARTSITPALGPGMALDGQGNGLRPAQEASSGGFRSSAPFFVSRSEKLDLRLTPAAKRTLYAAASAARLSVSEFVLESALTRAEETLADRRLFGLDAERWEAFMAALDAPPRPLPRLERLFGTPSVFEDNGTQP